MAATASQQSAYRLAAAPIPIGIRWWAGHVVLSFIGVLAAAAPSRAQDISSYFTPGVPGYATERGVTVLTRARPLYEEQTIDLGPFTVGADLDQAIDYNSNVSAQPHGAGSWLVSTNPALTLNSNWSSGSVGAAFSVQDSRYLNQPVLDHTDWTASIGAGYALGRGDLTVGYLHITATELPTELGAVASSTGTPYTVDDFRSSYSISLGKVTLTPNIDEEIFRYGTATIDGQRVSQSPLNNDVLKGGMTARYALTDMSGLLAVVQGIDTHYTRPGAGPDSDSQSMLGLFGLDYSANGLWRYQLLGGVQRTVFAASEYTSQTEPVVQAAAIYTPTGLTTITGTLSRSIEGATTPGTANVVFTNARLVIDHECQRNVLLQLRAGYQLAEYSGGGGGGSTQTNATIGPGVTWLLNRYARLTANYDFTTQSSGGTGDAPAEFGVAALRTGAYTESLASLTLHIGL